MIPFTIPNDHEIINLSQIVRVSEMQNGSIDVLFTNGERISYTGQAAQIIKGACMVNMNLFNSAIAATQSQIITANDPGPSRLM